MEPISPEPDETLAIAAELIEITEKEIPLFGATVVCLLDEDGELTTRVKCHGESYKYQIHGLFHEGSRMIDEADEE